MLAGHMQMRALPLQAGRVIHKLLEGEHGQQGNGELGYDQYAGNGAELVIHGHVVEEEVGEAHEVLAPGEQDAEHRGGQQTPLHGSPHDEEAQDEEHQHERANIHRATGAGLFAPVLSECLIDGHVGAVGMLHGCLALGKGHTGTALGVGHEQGPRFTQPVTPHGDIAALQSAARLIGLVLGLLRELTLAAHAFLAVLPGVVEVAQVDGYAQQACHGKARSSLRPLPQRVLAHRINKVGEHHQPHDKEEVIGHLHMVAQYLQGREQGCHHDARQIAAPIAQYHTGYGGWHEAQGKQLPDVSGCNDDEIVTAEGPEHSAQGGHPHAEVEGAQQDVEAQEHHKHVGRNVGESQLIHLLEPREGVCAVIAGAHLIGGHSAEEGVGPACALTMMSLAVMVHLHVAAYRGAVVVSRKHESVTDGCNEIEDADGHEEHHSQQVGKELPQLVHIESDCFRFSNCMLHAAELAARSLPN